MKKLTKIIAAILSMVFIGGLIAAPVFADEQPDDPFCNPEMGQAALDAMGCKDGQIQGGPAVADVVINIIEVVIGLLGIVAVVFIVIGGVTYMTSSGDSTKVKKAKDTILYALIGLVICALAFAIVNFAAGIINGDKTSPAENIIETSTGV